MPLGDELRDATAALQEFRGSVRQTSAGLAGLFAVGVRGGTSAAGGALAVGSGGVLAPLGLGLAVGGNLAAGAVGSAAEATAGAVGLAAAAADPAARVFGATGDFALAARSSFRSALQLVAATPFVGGATGATAAEDTLRRTEQRAIGILDPLARAGIAVPEDFRAELLATVTTAERRVTEERARVAGALGGVAAFAAAAPEQSLAARQLSVLEKIAGIMERATLAVGRRVGVGG